MLEARMITGVPLLLLIAVTFGLVRAATLCDSKEKCIYWYFRNGRGGGWGRQPTRSRRGVVWTEGPGDGSSPVSAWRDRPRITVPFAHLQRSWNITPPAP